MIKIIFIILSALLFLAAIVTILIYNTINITVAILAAAYIVELMIKQIDDL